MAFIEDIETVRVHQHHLCAWKPRRNFGAATFRLFPRSSVYNTAFTLIGNPLRKTLVPVVVPFCEKKENLLLLAVRLDDVIAKEKD